VIEDRDNPTYTAPAGSGGDLRSTAKEAGAAVQERAGELREAARSTLHDAQAAAAERTEAAKGQAAEEISRTARGLEAAAEELEGSPLQQELLREAADGLKQISSAVSGKSVGEMVEGLSNFGRQNPLAFLGGAALAGFALARFARASTPSDGYEDDYGSGTFPDRGVTAGAAGAYAPNAPFGTTNAPPTPATTPQVPASTNMGTSDDV
jgi:hypothetical protein